MPRRVYLLDAFDSFSFNVLSGLQEAGGEVLRRRLDEASVAEAQDFAPDLLVLGPGPGEPPPLLFEFLRAFAESTPILGICLGHQALALFFGGTLGRCPEPVHGKVAPLRHDRRGLFAGLPDPLEAARYHSLEVKTLPPELEACAWNPEGGIMALRHRTRPIAGLQFHPDSFLMPAGPEIFRHALAGRF